MRQAKKRSNLETYRLFLCARCLRQVSICAACDRGQWYCGKKCAQHSRRERVRAAGSRYQRSPQGRQSHAERQARYRQAQRAEQALGAGEVTHRGAAPPQATARIASSWPICTPPGQSVPILRSTLPPPSWVACTICGSLCQPYARRDSLRERGRRRMYHRRSQRPR